MPLPAPQIAAVDSVTQPGDAAGKVLVAGSHGGVIAAYLGAKSGAHALILNDAGLGKDRAGIAGLFYLDAIGMAAAAVDCNSARIGITRLPVLAARAAEAVTAAQNRR